jgi:hypothetical protein
MFKNLIKNYQEEFNKHLSKKIKKLISQCKKNKTQISLGKYKELRLNSYEQKRLIPYLNKEALVYHIEKSIANRSKSLSNYQLPSHYDEFLMTDGIDELLKRYKEVNNE